MESLLKRNVLDCVTGVNELCNCNCNLLVTEMLQNEITNKVDEASSKFGAYHHTKRETSAYCCSCKSLYHIEANYEASSKTDYDEIRAIKKVNYFDNMIKFKELRKQYENKDTFRLDVNGVNVVVLKVLDTEKVNQKIVYYNVLDNNRIALNQMHNKCCYKCDNNEMVIDERGIAIDVNCLYNGFMNFDEVCDEYYTTFYEDGDIEEILDKLSPGILVTEKDLEEDYEGISKLKL